MKILQVSPYLCRSSGGPAVSVRRLSLELARMGVQTAAAGVTTLFSDGDAAYWQPVQVHALAADFPRFFSYSAKFPRQLSAYRPDIVHSNGLWLYPHLAAYRYCAEQKTPLVVSPRGMLEPWAFRHNAWKKRPLWWAYEKRSLQSARVLHATAIQEAEALRGLGLTNPVAVIPNGVDLPADCSHLIASNGIRTALFLSRIHPKKGLLNLIKAWSIVRPGGWKMVIAGPQEAGHESELCEAVQRAGLQDIFDFVGPVFGEDKSLLFRQASLFILPSFSENFGIAIAEALASGVPVITTTGTPWHELEERDCGWWVDCGADSLAAALEKATRLSDDELRGMGMRGRRLVEERYSWTTVASDMKKVYEWILNDGAPPACVMTI